MTDVEALCNELSQHVRALRDGSEVSRRRATATARRIIAEITDPDEEIEQQTITVRFRAPGTPFSIHLSK
jgi:hypothetical protein